MEQLAIAAKEKWGQQAEELKQDLEITAEALSKLESFHPQPDRELPPMTPVLQALAQKQKNEAVRS